MTRRLGLSALCLASLIATVRLSSAQDAELPAWSIAYADGRVVTHVLRAKGGMWTPMFPRLQESSIAPGGSPKYLDIRYVAEGEDLLATVSLATSGFRDRINVATVRVRRGTPVVVDELSKYGVAPVTLSAGSIEPVQAYSPIAVEPSGQLVVHGEPIRPNVPIYRFQVTNQGGRALRAFDFDAYQGDTRILSGRRKNQRNEPLILPGQDYAFELTLSNKEGDAWRTLDRLVLTSVVWDNGEVDGDPGPAMHERALARSRAVRLQTLIKTLTSRQATRFDVLRAAFAGLDRSDYALSNARDEALTDLQRLEHAGADALKAWLATKIAEFAAWQQRCERAALPEG